MEIIKVLKRMEMGELNIRSYKYKGKMFSKVSTILCFNEVLFYS